MGIHASTLNVGCSRWYPKHELAPKSYYILIFVIYPQLAVPQGSKWYWFNVENSAFPSQIHLLIFVYVLANSHNVVLESSEARHPHNRLVMTTNYPFIPGQLPLASNSVSVWLNIRTQGIPVTDKTRTTRTPAFWGYPPPPTRFCPQTDRQTR